eukprot:TRINITY_DN40122_c0_g1_i1.p2 TRINITY_DN40122_c0_g1~~TRINITY_DN40122_c0_g1_i1.p2  ORF type:complete len:112 (-),score=2.83 TRINITY_DN40122_c0_g1_i1:78-368(-)
MALNLDLRRLSLALKPTSTELYKQLTLYFWEKSYPLKECSRLLIKTRIKNLCHPKIIRLEIVLRQMLMQMAQVLLIHNLKMKLCPSTLIPFPSPTT